MRAPRYQLLLLCAGLAACSQRGAPTRTADQIVEARYREASHAERTGDDQHARALLTEITQQYPRSARAARAWLDLGKLKEKAGRIAEARIAYAEVLGHPRSGLAERAAEALVRLDDAPHSAAYRKLLAPASDGRTSDPELDSFLRLRLARSLEAEGDLRAALLAYEDVAKRHPLPVGRHSDEALLDAARLRRRLGDAQGALRTIDVLLAAQAQAALVGSYERSAFAEARLLAATIHYQDLGDAARAEETLLSLVEHSETSRLRDDALLRAAWLAKEQGATKRACAHARALVSLSPPSVLVECAGLVCDETGLPRKESSRCARLIPWTASP